VPPVKKTKSSADHYLTLAKRIRSIIEDKKAEDILILKVEGLSSITDYIVLVSGTSEPHLKVLANEIERRLMEEDNVKNIGRDGSSISQWVVLDYGGVIVHIFHKSKREFYGLETLWKDAAKIK